MKELKYSSITKTLFYCLAPIFLTATIICLMSIFYVTEEPDTITTETYEETEKFCEYYLNDVYNLYSFYEYDYSYYEHTEDSIYQDNYNGNDKRFKYILETPEGRIHTNIAELTRENEEQIKKEILEEKIYLVKDGNEIQTTSELKNTEFYKYLYKEIDKGEKQVYTYIDQNYKKNYYDANELIYNISKTTYSGVIIFLPLSAIAFILSCAYLFSSVGHKNGKEGIYLNTFDKIPLEIAITIILGMYFSILFLTFFVINASYDATSIMSIGIIGGILIYLVSVLGFETILRRIKSHTFLKNTICVKIIKKFFEIGNNVGITLKAIIGYALFGLFTMISILNRQNNLSIMLLVILWGACGIYIVNRAIEYNKIRKFVQSMYEGNKTYELNENEFKGEFKKIVPKLNDIASGFSNAIEKEIQSERLKTELITNVSHDIKTPLTSIINYVDLIKKEEVTNEKLKEYIEIIDKKSQRLKKLTEDLVEASKASSGNIKLNKEILNIKELIFQEIGEFDEKFKEKGLQIIEKFQDNEILINADGKYMSRILDNVFSNISKYALPNSRVYIDAIEKKGKIEISFKNISANQLNITSNELMERFVRGDVSRTTEGSGLGLSIAKSLTELQGGTFEIYLDGDLFKVMIKF